MNSNQEKVLRPIPLSQEEKVSEQDKKNILKRLVFNMRSGIITISKHKRLIRSVDSVPDAEYKKENGKIVRIFKKPLSDIEKQTNKEFFDIIMKELDALNFGELIITIKDCMIVNYRKHPIYRFERIDAKEGFKRRHDSE